MKQPNPADLLATWDYVEDQALQGRFDGQSMAYAVLLYFIKHSWRVVPNDECAPIGAVLSGKSGHTKIAKSIGSSRRTVQRALQWLEMNLWIKSKPIYGDTGRQDWNQYRVLLDQSGHDQREEYFEMMSLRGVRQNDAGGASKWRT